MPDLHDQHAPGPLPEGTVTMLFSDVESSTALLARLGSRYGDVVSTQRRLLREAFARWGGRELGTEGDSFFVVFTSATHAVAAAREAQEAVAAASWPDGAVVRVRMGLHTGEPVRHEDGYVGMDVHRAARVAASAHGGQVLLTEPAYRIAVGAHDAASALRDVTFRDLGTHRFKDVPEPERVHQLCVPGLPDRFPPLRSLGSASVLPRPDTSLVGRAPDVAALAEVVTAGARLTTLTGPAGTGKTRLALAAAEALDGRFADGVYFVSLAPVTTVDVMWSAVADALGTPGESKAPPSFLEHLAPRQVLLVLDNLEQLPDAATVVRALLEASPRTQVVATSRRPLHLSGEHEVPVRPLDEDAAVELYASRARLVRPGFEVTAGNRRDVVEICRRLDHLPLAVEVVAARAKLLSPRATLDRLDQVLEPNRPLVDVPARQQTLRAALDWSHELLPEHLRRTFRRLGVCEGDVDLPTVAALTGTADPLDDVAELVDASLLTVADGDDGEPRARMLRTVARYARQRLDEDDDDADGVRDRHAAHFLARAEDAAGRLRGPDHLRARDRLEHDLDDLRAVLDRGLGSEGGARTGPARPASAGGAAPTSPDERFEVGLRLCATLSWFWYASGYQAEGRRHLEAAVAAVGDHRTDEAMTALHGLAVIVLQQGEAERARDLLRMCLEHWRGSARGDAQAAVSAELNSLALAHRALGEPDTARELLHEAVDAARAADDASREVNAVSNLAILATDAGRHEESIPLLRRCLELDEALGDAWGTAADHVNLTNALLRAGRVDEAHAHLTRHGAACVEVEDVEITADVLGLFGVVHALRGEVDLAARALGAAGRLREQAGIPLAAPDAAWLDEAVGPARDASDPDRWSAGVEDGAGLGVEDALRMVGVVTTSG
ncbi:tetratricopeptide repeat protein [Actinotalea sp. AC32]|nr:tetratricopeptide repeat protein [Actinotalea sp. AC32]